MEGTGPADSGAAFFFTQIKGIKLAAATSDEFVLGEYVALHDGLHV